MNNLILYVLIIASNTFSVSFGGNCECGKSSFSRIIGGVQTPKLKYPWITALCYSSPCNFFFQFCAGSLIHSQYVLTAAHCVYFFFPGELTVSVGDWDLNSPNDVESVERQVSQIFYHEYYDFSSENDIGLLKLETPVVFSDTVRPICLPPPTAGINDFAGKSMTVIGWGTTNLELGVSLPKLREVLVKALPNGICNKQYIRFGYRILPTMICAAAPERDSCYGDSGGPMAFEDPKTLKWQVAGIVSFGFGCADPKFAGVYTRVSRYIDWIEGKMTGATQCS